MILNGNHYKLVLLDTNIIRETVKNIDKSNTTNKVATNLMVKLFSNKCIPCYSFYNVLEIKPYGDLFKNFLSVFKHIPSMMFYPYSEIITEEFKAYKNNKYLEITGKIAFALNCEEYNPETTIEFFLENESGKNMFNTLTPEYIREHLEDIRQTWLKGKRDIKKKYGKDIDIKEIKKDYTNINISSLLGINIVDEKVDLNKLPASMMMLYSFFHRICLKKDITLNDVMDVTISAIAPYVDIVITENFQAEVYKQAKNHIPQLKNLEILRLSDLNKLNK